MRCKLYATAYKKNFKTNDSDRYKITYTWIQDQGTFMSILEEAERILRKQLSTETYGNEDVGYKFNLEGVDIIENQVCDANL